MSLKRLIKKGILGGAPGLIEGHIIDALSKKAKTGRKFRDCLEESVQETVKEDMPGTSHLYQWGHTDGKIKGTIEQAERDEKKIKEIHEKHEAERASWSKIDKEKDKFINDMEKHFR